MKNKHELIMLATDKAINIPVIQYFQDGTQDMDFWNTEVQREHPLTGFTEYQANCIVPQHLYILSDDEIKETDWKYNVVNKSITKQDGGFSYESDKKIIATTDSSLNLPLISSVDPKVFFSFIHYFISEYNKGNVISSVSVEYE